MSALQAFQSELYQQGVTMEQLKEIAKNIFPVNAHGKVAQVDVIRVLQLDSNTLHPIQGNNTNQRALLTPSENTVNNSKEYSIDNCLKLILILQLINEQLIESRKSADYVTLGRGVAGIWSATSINRARVKYWLDHDFKNIQNLKQKIKNFIIKILEIASKFSTDNEYNDFIKKQLGDFLSDQKNIVNQTYEHGMTIEHDLQRIIFSVIGGIRSPIKIRNKTTIKSPADLAADELWEEFTTEFKPWLNIES
jgi:hypothetical protein